jgi:transcriptional regulator with XRE-family HTH domain
MMKRGKVAVAFGRVLKDLRREMGITQEELAMRGGFDRTYPSLLERGLRTPTLTVIFRLADVLDIRPEVLVDKALKEYRAM